MANVFFITCHRSRDLVADLVRQLQHPDNQLILHCDRKAPVALQRLVEALPQLFANVTTLPGQFYSWAGFSMVDTTLEAMRVALGLESPWRHFFWISEQHMALWPQTAEVWRLDPDLSYADCHRMRDLHPEGIADVRHRFARRLRELPGVGSFAAGPGGLDDAMEERIMQGSNWMALSRQACSVLLDRAAEPRWRDLFANALHADETMLQTLLMASDDGIALPVNRFNPSWIAWPHLSGNGDMIFADANVATAREGGHLFIRKRPDMLSPEMRAEVDSMAAVDAATLEQALATVPAAASPGRPQATDALIVDLARAMSGDSDLPVRLLRPFEFAHVPALYLVLLLPDAPHNLRVCVLSEDLRTYKVLVVADIPFDGDFNSKTLFGHAAELLRVRVHDLFLAREIEDPAAEDHGFVKIENDDLAPVRETIRRTVGFAKSLKG